MTDTDRLLAEAAKEQQQEIEAQIKASRVAAKARRKRQFVEQKRRIRALENRLLEYEDLRQRLAAVEANPLAPRVIEPLAPLNPREGVACLLLSDLHFEERVDPRTVNGLNEFNLEIAKERIERLCHGFRWYLSLVRKHYDVRQLYVPLLGDNVTNNLRQDDLRGNFLDPFPAVLFAAERLVEVFDSLLADDAIERIEAPLIVGNHDRMPGSPRQTHTDRTDRSLVYLLADKLLTHYRDEPRVNFELSYSAHHYTEIYGRTVRACHGDGFRYNKGVGGIYVGARRYIRDLNATKHADLTVFGHHHQHKKDRDWISNSALIGYSEYAADNGFPFEQASQVAFLIDKHYGARLTLEIGLQGHIL